MVAKGVCLTPPLHGFVYLKFSEAVMAFIVDIDHTNVAQRTKPESDPVITYTGFIR